VAEESEKERLDRELIELLNELRVALPGVQVLFAFLLGLPFTQRFEQVTGATEVMYVVSLLSAAAASAFLIAPSAHHRMRWRASDKERLLQTSNRQAIVGTTLLALGIASSVYVVVSFLYGNAYGIPVAAALAALLVALWYALPLYRRHTD
jgi:Na+/H+ antiporter NhaD/arsenite permease-like protein